MGKRSPSPPSPAESANAQAQANRINQITPFGNLTFSGPNRNTATTTLSGGLRNILDQQLTAQREAATRANQLGNVVLGQTGRPNIPGSVNYSGPGTSGLLDALKSFGGELNSLPGVTGTRGVLNAERAFSSGLGALGGVPEFTDPTQGAIRRQRQRFNVGLSRLGEVPEFNDPTGDALARALTQFNTEVGELGDLPEFQTTAFDRERIEDAVFDRGRRLLDPVQEQQREQLQSRLANQGLPQAGGAYNDEFNRLGQQQDLALADLADRAILLGGQESDRVFGQDLGAFQAALQGRGQGVQEALGGLGARTGVAGQQFGQALQDYGADLTGRQQSVNEITGRLGSNLQALGQQFGQNLQGFGANLGARQQAVNELQQSFANSLSGQAQRFGQTFANRQQGLQEALARYGTRAGNQQQRFDQSLANFNIDNQQRQQNIERELLRRQIPLNEMQALLGLSQTQQPSFFGPGQIDVVGPAALQSQVAQQNAANRGGLFGSLIGLGGQLGGAGILAGLFG